MYYRIGGCISRCSPIFAQNRERGWKVKLVLVLWVYQKVWRDGLWVVPTSTFLFRSKIRQLQVDPLANLIQSMFGHRHTMTPCQQTLSVQYKKKGKLQVEKVNLANQQQHRHSGQQQHSQTIKSGRAWGSRCCQSAQTRHQENTPWIGPKKCLAKT